MTLQTFLDNKPLFYDEIDYTRMPRVYEKIKHYFPQTKTIHLIGTNGKGTTGRFLASALHALGYNVGHYTSPHIVEFNERIWFNGTVVDDTTLNDAHQKLQTLLEQEDADALSYFEYTTFLAMLIYEKCDYIVLEAGLGGEHDATAVFEKTLTLVTPIDYDHEAFLGSSIEEIALTKLGAIQNNAIIAQQKHPEVLEVAKKLMQDKNIHIYVKDEFLGPQDLSYIKEISKKLVLPLYLEENLALAISALKFLDVAYSSDNFTDAKLFGRLTHYKENIILDVGHNPLAATSILNALKGKKYVLIYNSYKDKEYKKILQILKPIIQHVEIIELEHERVALTQQLQNVLNELEIEYTTLQNITPQNNYLVFGSFSVVEAFLREYS